MGGYYFRMGLFSNDKLVTRCAGLTFKGLVHTIDGMLTASSTEYYAS